MWSIFGLFLMSYIFQANDLESKFNKCERFWTQNYPDWMLLARNQPKYTPKPVLYFWHPEPGELVGIYKSSSAMQGGRTGDQSEWMQIASLQTWETQTNTT